MDGEGGWPYLPQGGPLIMSLGLSLQIRQMGISVLV